MKTLTEMKTLKDTAKNILKEGMEIAVEIKKSMGEEFSAEKSGLAMLELVLKRYIFEAIDALTTESDWEKVEEAFFNVLSITFLLIKRTMNEEEFGSFLSSVEDQIDDSKETDLNVVKFLILLDQDLNEFILGEVDKFNVDVLPALSLGFSAVKMAVTK